MASILIQIDGATMKSLNRIVPAVKRQRAEFIRQAVKGSDPQAGVRADSRGISPPAGLVRRCRGLVER